MIVMVMIMTAIRVSPSSMHFHVTLVPGAGSPVDKVVNRIAPDN